MSHFEKQFKALAVGLALLAGTAGTTFAASSTSRNILKTMELAADWELAHPESASVPATSYDVTSPRGWVVGTFYTGLTALADRSGNPKYTNAILKLGEKENWSLGPRPFHADDYEVAQNWIWAYTRARDPQMISEVKNRFDYIIAENPSGSLMMAAPSDPGGNCFQRWCWCDALFMGPPSWMGLSAVTNNSRYSAYADKEYKAATHLLFDESESLYYRDSSFFDKRGAKGEKLFWSRGNGWVYAGLARVLTILPTESPYRGWYQDLFLKMSLKLVAIQKADGSWAPSLLDSATNTPPETSGTAFYTYGLAWGVKSGLLKEPKYRKAAARGWSLLKGAVQNDGKLGWVQQVGSKPDDVREDHTQPFGVGAFLLAGSAMYDLERN